MEERPTEFYGNMLEKYREVDEDEILSNLTKEELQQLEGEIDREVLNKIPEDVDDEENLSSQYEYSSTSDEEEECEMEYRRPRLSTIQTKHLNRSLEKQRSLEAMEIKRKSSKPSNQFKIPSLRKTKSREELKRQKSEEGGGEMKKELLQAVKRRTKRRTSRANSSGLARRYNRRNSSCLLRIRRPKVAKEDRKNSVVNMNFVTEEMLSLRPKLKKVKTREPAQVNDMLHGVSLSHITSGAKTKGSSSDISLEESDEIKDEDKGSFDDETSGEENVPEEEATTSPGDDEVASANDKIYRRLSARTLNADVKNDDATSYTTAGSTSAESYDVIGELSINPNSVEEMLLRIWEDDEYLVEVNLNNIQNVSMEVFEELASAMEGNTHVKQLNLANVGLTDKPARALASMLKKNKTLEKLNVESNFITGEAALRLVAALRKNQVLTELRIDNQRHIFGAKVEHEFSKILKDNKTLLRFGYQFHNPGPRMAASNSLTRNMDDLRKKRVIEQKRKMQMNRPTIRRQPSSEWRRVERDEKLRKIQEQGIPLDLQNLVQDEEVKRVLGQMDSSQYALLEKWFVTKLLEQDGGETQPHSQTHQHSKPPQKLIPSSKRQVRTQRSDPRGKLMESIRNPGQLTPVQKRKNTKPASPSDDQLPRQAARLEENSSKEKFCAHQGRPKQSKPSDPGEVVESWKEGDSYDSDQYEVVEIEVSESDESAIPSVLAESPRLEVKSQDNANSYRPQRIDLDRLIVPGYPSDDSSDSSTSSPWSPRHLPRHHSHDPTQKFSKLQLEDCQFLPSQNRRARQMNFTSSSLPSTPLPSPATRRKVVDDESWIARRPHYRLGAK